MESQYYGPTWLLSVPMPIGLNRGLSVVPISNSVIHAALRERRSAHVPYESPTSALDIDSPKFWYKAPTDQYKYVLVLGLRRCCSVLDGDNNDDDDDDDDIMHGGDTRMMFVYYYIR
jgi:hypothetical protein